VKALRLLADELNILIAYDASHVTGLIAAGVFPNPLSEGADIMFGSTHKSFPGPQGGFVASNRHDLMVKVGNTLSPSLVTSHHLNRLPALAASILEMKEFGKITPNRW
jgi:glycine hydroxymethyltransferase